MKLNCELFYTDLRKFSAQSYICWAFLILPTSAHKEEMIVSRILPATSRGISNDVGAVD